MSDELGTSNLEMWAFIVGALVPPVAAYLNRWAPSQAVRALIPFGLAIIVGLGNAYFAGHLHWDDDLIASVLIAIVATITSYNGLWKPTGIAPKIEGVDTHVAPDTVKGKRKRKGTTHKH